MERLSNICRCPDIFLFGNSVEPAVQEAASSLKPVSSNDMGSNETMRKDAALNIASSYFPMGSGPSHQLNSTSKSETTIMQNANFGQSKVGNAAGSIDSTAGQRHDERVRIRDSRVLQAASGQANSLDENYSSDDRARVSWNPYDIAGPYNSRGFPHMVSLLVNLEDVA